MPLQKCSISKICPACGNLLPVSLEGSYRSASGLFRPLVRCIKAYVSAFSLIMIQQSCQSKFSTTEIISTLCSDHALYFTLQNHLHPICIYLSTIIHDFLQFFTILVAKPREAYSPEAMWIQLVHPLSPENHIPLLFSFFAGKC
jgi:hypothetical protein